MTKTPKTQDIRQAGPAVCVQNLPLRCINTALDITTPMCHHGIRMRTTLDVDPDVLDVARSLAQARRISIGKALSYLARRGATAQVPTSVRNGFCVFNVPADAPRFGPDDISRALDEGDASMGRYFVDPARD